MVNNYPAYFGSVIEFLYSLQNVIQSVPVILKNTLMPKLANYIIQNQVLARGFSSIVYKAIDKTANEQVAMKRIDESVLDSLYKKKMLSNQLRIQWLLKEHPNIVEIKAQLYEEDAIYIVSQYCQYGDLKTKIQKKGKLVEAKAVSYIIDIINGFQVMVKNGIVHRDIRPANILISKNGAKIGDFGYAYQTSQSQGERRDESSRHNVGSPSYMAPEVLLDSKNSSHISDIWSIGVVFYEMLAGKLPFIAKNRQHLIKIIQHTGIRSIIPQDLSLKSKQFLLRTLKKEPQRRITPQQLFSFEFDDEILFKIHQHKMHKEESQKSKKLIGQKQEIQKTNQSSEVKINFNSSVSKQQQRKKVNPEAVIQVKQLLKRDKNKNLQVNFKQFDSNDHHGKQFLDPKDIKAVKMGKRKIIETKEEEKHDREYKQDLMIESTVDLIFSRKKQLQQYKKSEKNKDHQLQNKVNNLDGTRKRNLSGQQKKEKNYQLQSEVNDSNEARKRKLSDHTYAKFNTKEKKEQKTFQKEYINLQKDKIHSYKPKYSDLPKQTIIDILLAEIDVIRFLSRILHRIQEIHHIKVNEPSINARPHVSSSNSPHKQKHPISIDKQIEKRNNLQEDESHPKVYVQMKLFILKKLKDIQRISFLQEDQAQRFKKSQAFQKILVILDTYKTKIDHINLKTTKWQGLNQFGRLLEQEILLIHYKIKQIFIYYKSHTQDPDIKQLKRLHHKIEVLSYLIVFKNDYLDKKREEKDKYDALKIYENCKLIQQIVSEKHKESKVKHKQTIEESFNEFLIHQKTMKEMKII